MLWYIWANRLVYFHGNNFQCYRKIIFQTKDLWVSLFCRDLTVKAGKVISRAGQD